MRTSIPVSCLMFFCVSLCGQAVTIDNESAKVEYYRLPDQPLDPSYSTYSANIQVSFSELANTGLSKSSLIDQYIRLEGFKKVSEHGDVEITANIGDFTIWSESRSSRRTKTKDKNGVEHVKYNYYMEVRYSLPMSLAVYDKKGFLLMDRSISSSSNTQTWTSPSYSDLSDLESYWRI
ncbi:MAG TPA: hypothetical protein VJ508_07200, partial [Saprospiraceae bacterium]|nr:hypothetical protein [Saprospiraceae bacterium]